MPGPFQTYEKDPRWTAVDEYALSHLHPPTTPYHSELQYAIKHSHEQGLPDIAVSPLQGAFLQMQCKLINASHVLEVGTLGGYSTIWLASAHPNLRVTTVEIDAHHASVARESFANAGLADRIEVLVGAGLDVLPGIAKDVKDGKRPPFDFVFIDADKPNNLGYLELAVPMCRSRAEIVVDNVVRKGDLADAKKAETNAQVRGSRAVVEGAGKHEGLEATLIQIVGEKNYDGFLICMVK